jgi:hypothetical protein
MREPRLGFGDAPIGNLFAALVADSDAPCDQNSYVDVLAFRQRWDYSRDGTLRSIDDNLVRLNTSRLDVVYIHDIDRRTHGAQRSTREFDQNLRLAAWPIPSAFWISLRTNGLIRDDVPAPAA